MWRLAIGVGLTLLALGTVVRAQGFVPASVGLETSRDELPAPGLVGVRVTILDTEGRRIPPRRLPAGWEVRITSGRAAVAAELEASPVAPAIEGDVLLRRAGLHELRGELYLDGVGIAASEPVPVLSVGHLDFGVVRAGETSCRQVPGGGRGLRGRVIGGELPPGVRLWGACLVADDSVAASRGTVRAEIAAVSPSGSRVDRQVLDVTYRVEPRLVTPRRALLGFFALAFLAMIALVGVSFRGRRIDFGSGTILAWTVVEGSPYRGERVTGWRVAEVAAAPVRGRRAVLDLGTAVGGAMIRPGLLRARPTDDGRVELSCPAGEELRATTPEGVRVVASKRVVVPYGSTVAFRNVGLALLVGDAADVARAGGAGDILDVPRG